jgi:hypothetical protein
MPVAVAPNGGSKSHPNPEADECGSRVVIVIVHIHHGGIVRGYVNHLLAGWLHLDDRIGHINNLVLVCPFHHGIGGSHNLLRAGFELARCLSFGAECLNGIHQIHRLVDKSLAQLGRPSNIRVHHRNDLGKPGHLLDFVIPGLLVQFGDIVGVLDESRRLHHFDGIHRGRKNDGDERVRVKRNRCGELLQISGTALGGGGRRSCGRAGCRGGVRGCCDGDAGGKGHENDQAEGKNSLHRIIARKTAVHN